MRVVLLAGLSVMLSAAGLMVAGNAAQAQRYRVVCTAPGAPNCRVSCGSNTHTVVCYASVRNGRCVKYCGPKR